MHPEKARLVDLLLEGSYVDFLGFRFKRLVDRRTGHRRLIRDLRPKSRSQVRDTIRRHTRRLDGRSLAEIVSHLSASLRGWSGYFRSAIWTVLADLDGMVRRRLRAILAKRHGVPSWGGGACQIKWTHAFLEHQGLFSLRAAHEAHVQSRRSTR